MLRLIRFDRTFVSKLGSGHIRVQIALRFLSVLARLLIVCQVIGCSGFEIHSLQ